MTSDVAINDLEYHKLTNIPCPLATFDNEIADGQGFIETKPMWFICNCIVFYCTEIHDCYCFNINGIDWVVILLNQLYFM